MLRFFLSLVGVSFLIIAVTYFALQQGWLSNEPSFLRETLLLLVITTFFIFRYLFKAGNPMFFVQLYMGTIAIKLLAYGAFCFWMVRVDRPGAALNIGFFLLVYFLFTGLEIAFLFRKISGANRP